jgi:TolA-binding protein
MSTESDVTDDLLIRARRDMLLEDEERRLGEVLASSSETRLLFEAGCAFDGEAPVLPGDDARIERMVRAVEQRAPRRHAPGPRSHFRAVAVGMLLGAAAVAAGEASRSLFGPPPPLPRSAQEATSATLGARHVIQAPQATSAPAEAAPATQEAASAPPVTSHDTGRGVPAAPVPRTSLHLSPEPSSRGLASPVAQVDPDAVVVAPPSASGRPLARFDDVTRDPASEARTVTATELFAAGNRARMQADSARSISAYRRLEAEFPESAEALSARLSLGMLYLHAGQAGLALEQFRAYRTLGHGPTLGEALWGESRALHQLDRRAEERSVLQELLERFPDSAYATAARKRLAEP